MLQDFTNLVATDWQKEKILIAPSFHAGNDLINSYLLQGNSYLNLHITTINAQLEEYYEKNLSFQYKLLDGLQYRIIVEKIISQLAIDRKLQYFGQLYKWDKLADCFANTISELRYAGIFSSALQEKHFLVKQKFTDIKNIVCEYEKYLNAYQYIDLPGVLEIALAETKERKLICSNVVIMPDIEISLRKQRFVECYIGSDLKSIGNNNNNNILNNNVQFSAVAAYGENNEIRAVLRDVFRKNINIDHCQIVCCKYEKYSQIIANECNKLDIPVTFSAGLPAINSRPGRLIKGLINWIKQDFSVDVIYWLLQSGDLQFDTDNKKMEDLDKLTDQLIKANIGWGRERYKCLNGSLGKYLNDLLNNIPTSDCDGNIYINSIAQGLMTIFKNCQVIKDEFDRKAAESVQSILNDFATINDWKLSTVVAVEKIEQELLSSKVGSEKACSGALHVISIEQIGWLQRNHTYVVGLNFDNFPGSGLQDPLLLDMERKNINSELKIFANKPILNNKNFKSALGSLSGSLTISYCNYFPVDNERGYPASIFTELINEKNINIKDIEAKKIHYIVADDILLDQTDYLYKKLFKNPSAKKLVQDIVQDKYPFLNRGLLADRLRQSNEMTEYDGKISEKIDKYNPLFNNAIKVSASRLELLAKCPFAYFLKHILKITPLEKFERDENVWLNAMNYGLVLHDIFEIFTTKMKEKNIRPLDYEHHKEQILKIADDVLKNLEKKIPAPNEFVKKNDWEKVYNDCQVFLKLEKDNINKPELFELPFGIKETQNQSNYCSAIAIDCLGKKLLLSGRIDRIDFDEKHNGFNIIDYKTGSTYNYNENEVFNHGCQLQPALYILALTNILPELQKRGLLPHNINNVLQAGYVFPTRKGEGQMYMLHSSKTKKITEVLNKLLLIIEEKIFHCRINNAKCNYCDYKSACRFYEDKIDWVMKNSSKKFAWKELQNDEYK